MTEMTTDQVLLVASEEELAWTHPSWGTGGWVSPEQREALDWLTLSRLSGWGVTVATTPNLSLHAGSRWIVVGCDPETLGDDWAAYIQARLAAEPLLVITRGGRADTPLARLSRAQLRPETICGRSLMWKGPGLESSWTCRNVVTARRLEFSDDVSVWLEMDGLPVVVARRLGRGVMVTLGFHPSGARDADGAMTAMLKHLLIWGALAPVAWMDFEHTMVLRMDDPGGAQNVYNRNFCYPKLNEVQWAAIGRDLQQRQARLSMAYVSGWVDDGAAKRGTLKVGGHEPPRVPAKVYPSPHVLYEDRAGHRPGTFHDYQAEFRGIQALRSAGLGDVELHGYTHVHPDRQAWLAAADRYETWPATSWYRELGEPAKTALAALPAEQHPLVLGMAAFREHFEIRPTTLIPPGDQWTNEVLEMTLDLGLILVDSYYLAIRDTDRFCWCTHVCSPYLDKPDAAWFDSGLPVVGYFHDFEPAVYGVEWMSKWLDRWQKVGARRFIDFRELAAAVGRHVHLEDRDGALSLTVGSRQAPALVRPLPVNIRVPDGKLSSKLSATIDGAEVSFELQSLQGGLGRVVLPPRESFQF